MNISFQTLTLMLSVSTSYRPASRSYVRTGTAPSRRRYQAKYQRFLLKHIKKAFSMAGRQASFSNWRPASPDGAPPSAEMREFVCCSFLPDGGAAPTPTAADTLRRRKMGAGLSDDFDFPAVEAAEPVLEAAAAARAGEARHLYSSWTPPPDPAAARSVSDTSDADCRDETGNLVGASDSLSPADLLGRYLVMPIYCAVFLLFTLNHGACLKPTLSYFYRRAYST